MENWAMLNLKDYLVLNSYPTRIKHSYANRKHYTKEGRQHIKYLVQELRKVKAKYKGKKTFYVH